MIIVREVCVMKKKLLGLTLLVTITFSLVSHPMAETNIEGSQVVTYVENTQEVQTEEKADEAKTEKVSVANEKAEEKAIEEAKKKEADKKASEEAAKKAKKAKEKKAQKKLVSKIKKQISALYDGEILTGGTQADVQRILEQVDNVKNKKKQKKLRKTCETIETLIEKRDSEAEEAVRDIWNFNDGLMQLGTDREAWENAKALVDALPESDLKDNLYPAIEAVDALLTAQQEQDRPEVSTPTTDGTTDGSGADVNDITPSLDGRLGDAGRLYIPSVGLSVALYQARFDDGYNQYITDAQDAAVYFPRACIASDGSYNNDPMIADHRHQGFDAIKSVTPGYTRAYIYDGNGNLSVYLCNNLFTGHNTGWGITDEYGNNAECMGNDLLTYTCNDHWTNVTIATWTCIDGYRYGESRDNPNVVVNDENTIVL